MATEMNEGQASNRKSSDYVTIVHLSDLHFDQNTAFPNEPNHSILGQLLKDPIGRKCRPDLVCVTGDIAENPFREALKRGEHVQIGEASRSWEETLGEAFSRGRDFLYAACRYWGVEPDTHLFVIPGNHDFRIQGMYGGKLARNRVQQARREFEKIFGSHMRSATTTFNDPAGGNSIETRIVCIDSNYGDTVLNFATGLITSDELSKVEYLTAASLGNSSISPRTIPFRIVLVHHHPLPVVSSEYVPDFPIKLGLSDRIQNILRVLMGEQTNVFKNPGVLLKKAMDHKADLILHGHQHHSWYSSISYPHQLSRRMLVAGAPSISHPGHGRTGYVVYKLFSNGNIEVIERTTATVPIEYEDTRGTPFSLLSKDEARHVRREKAVEQIEQHEGSVPNRAYGLARAKKLIHSTQILESGNAIRSLTFLDLRSTEQCEFIPISRYVPSGYCSYLALPRVRILENCDYYEKAEWVAATPAGLPADPTQHSESTTEEKQESLRKSVGLKGFIKFEPPLHPDKPISFVVNYSICNAFQFVEEYQRGLLRKTGENPDSRESLSFVSRSIYPDHLHVDISFPKRLSPRTRPLIKVLKPCAQGQDAGVVDTDEHDNVRSSLHYDPGSGHLSLSVSKPLPAYTYLLSWGLFPEKEYLPLIFNNEGLAAQSRVRQVKCSPSLKDDLEKECNGLASKISELTPSKLPRPIIDDSTAVRLYYVKYSSAFYGDQREVLVELVPCAAVQSSRKPVFGDSFLSGIGVVGQAFANRKEQLFIHDRQEGSDFYIVRKSDSEQKLQPHSAIFCIPLATGRSVSPYSPIFAVLCFSSLSDDTGLLQLESDPRVIKPFLDLAKGTFSENAYNLLLKHSKNNHLPRINPL